MTRPKDRSADFWEPRKIPLVFLVASALFGMSGSLAAMAFEPLTRTWWTCLLAGPVLASIIILTPLLRRIWPPQRVEFFPTLDKAQPCRGLVVLVSQGSGIETAQQAIRYHASTLEWIWLVHSDASKPDAERSGATRQ